MLSLSLPRASNINSRLAAKTRLRCYSGVGDTVELANVVLLRRGYLGCSPLQPTVCLSLAALDVYHQTRLACPRFSAQAQARVLCRLHNVRESWIVRTCTDIFVGCLLAVP